MNKPIFHSPHLNEAMLLIESRELDKDIMIQRLGECNEDIKNVEAFLKSYTYLQSGEFGFMKDDIEYSLLWNQSCKRVQLSDLKKGVKATRALIEHEAIIRLHVWETGLFKMLIDNIFTETYKLAICEAGAA